MDDQLVSPEEMSRSCLCLNAQRRARRIARHYDAAFRGLGLTSGQFTILAALNGPEPIGLGVLAELLGLERTTLTRNLAALEQAGLVANVPAEHDRRLRMLELTSAGRARLRMAMPVWREAQETAQA